jgi:uncharacterized protein YjdB
MFSFCIQFKLSFFRTKLSFMKNKYTPYNALNALSAKAKTSFFSIFLLAGVFLFSKPAAAQCPGWDVVGTAGFSGTVWYTTMATSSTGTPYVFYAWDGTVKKFNGATWENVGGVVNPGDGIYNALAITIGPGDVPYVAFDNQVGSARKVAVKKFDGSDWVMVGDSTFSGEVGTAMSIAVSSSGTPYVLYGDYTLGGRAVVKKFNGTAWETVGAEGFSPAGIDYFGYGAATIKIDGSGVPYVAYDHNGSEVMVQKFNGSAWETIGSFSGSMAYGHNILALNSSGAPYVAMSNPANVKSNVLKYNGATWDTVGNPDFSLGQAGYISLSIDAYDNVHFAYLDYAEYTVSGSVGISVKGYFGGNWVYEGCARFLAPDGGAAIDLAIGVGNVPYIAFIDPSVGNKVTVMKLGCVSEILGTTSACIGATTTLTESRPSGTWSSSNTAIATIGSASGIVTGVASGTVMLSYSFGSGCVTTKIFTVNPYAGTITGPSSLSAGNYITLNNGGFPGGGTWSSSSTAVATVNAGGSVTGVATGTTTISYANTGGCGAHTATKIITVTAAVAPLTCPQWDTLGDAGFSGSTEIYTPVITVDANGTPYAAYIDYAGTQKITVKKYNGSAWVTVGSPDFSSEVNNSDMTMAMDWEGTPYVAYASGSNIFVAKYNGSSWVAIGDAFIAEGGYWPSMAIDKTGTPYLIFCSFSTGIKAMKYNGTNWVTVGPTIYVGYFGYFPRITIDQAGVPYIATGCNIDNMVSALKYNGTGWDILGGGSLSAGEAYYASISIHPSGTPYVAYQDIVNDGKVTVQKFNGIGWDLVGTAGFTGGNAYPSDILVDGNGTPYVSYVDDASGYLGTVSKYDGSNWVTVGNAGFSAGPVYNLSMALDGSGNPYLYYAAYYGEGSGTVKKLSSGTVEAITGNVPACAGGTIYLSNATSGGTWSSSNTAVGTVNSVTGEVTGISVGTTTISYVVGSCSATTVVSVNPGTYLEIQGGLYPICQYIYLKGNIAGGTWSSSNTAVATVGTNGKVSRVSAGTATITYTHSSGCNPNATLEVTVSPLPDAGTITGTATLTSCTTTTLASTTSLPDFEEWFSGSASATVSSTGVVSGVSPGTSVITYRAHTAWCGYQDTHKTVTVNASAADISGSLLVCASSTTTLSGASGGGTWSSSNVSKATVGSATGIVSGVASGTASISYTLGGCTTSKVVTVNGSTNAGTISGGSNVTQGLTTLLRPSVTGGTWSGGSASISISPVGMVTGVATGTGIVTYTATNGCSSASTTATVTVNTRACPEWEMVGGYGFNTGRAIKTKILIDPTGVPYVFYINWNGTDSMHLEKYSGGAWVPVGDLSGVPGGQNAATFALSPSGVPYIAYADDDSYEKALSVIKYNGTSWEQVGRRAFNDEYSGGSFGGNIVIDSSGTPWVSTVSQDHYTFSVYGGTAVMKFNGTDWEYVGDPVIGMPGSGYHELAVDESGTPYSTTWNYLNYKANVFKYNGTSWVNIGVDVTDSTHYFDMQLDNAGTPYIAYSGLSNGGKANVLKYNGSTWDHIGAANFTAGAASDIKLRFDGSNIPYVGFFDGSNNDKGTVMAFNGSSWQTIGSAGFTPGTTTANIAVTSGGAVYFAGGNYYDNGAASVFKLASTLSSITGTASTCVSGTTTLSNATAGGSWSSSNIAVATIGSTTGIVSGVANGTATISYTVGACSATTVVTVSAGADAGTIAGTATVCTSATTTLSNATTGGTWSSGNTSVATIGSASGVVTGVTSGTSTITYTVTTGCGTATATQVVTVNTTPSAGTITGTLETCAGSSTTLGNASTGGIWSSGNTSVATVGSSSGIVSGVATGNATITYTVTSSCGTASTTATVTVNGAPSSSGSITGTLSLCTSATTTLSNATTGGAWSSSNTSVATVGSSSGIVSGVSGGNATITYTVTNECGSATTTAIVTVNATPSVSGITGTLTVCTGATTSLNNATGGGAWTSSLTGVATVSGTGVVSGIAAGNTTISYTVTNSCGTNAATAIVTVNPTPNAGTITGSSSVNTGATITLSNAASGGAWSSSNSNATVNSSGVVTGVTVGTATISYTVTNSCGTAVAIKVITINSSLSAITGSMAICVGGTTTLGVSEPGGTWSTSNTLFATVGSATGIVTGITPGTVTISYTLSGGTVTAVVTINGNPAISSGTLSACPGSTLTLSGAPSGGIWSSSNTGVATVSGGIVNGVSSGTARISYTNGAGCADTRVVTINSSPAAISGSTSLCVGSTTTLTNSTGGGTWSGTATSVIDGPGCCGIITGMNAGTANITYSMPTGCKSVITLTVNGAPANITGTLKACPGTTTALACATGGGTWNSGNTSIATIGSTGIVAGVAAGTTVISYSLGTGCSRTAILTVNPNPSASVAGSTTVCVGLNTTMSNSTPGMVSWSSSNTSVATVFSTGVVNGVSAGTANITYTIGSGCYTTTQITVNAKPTISGATSVCLGNTLTLSSPTSGGTWSSNNTAAATIGSATGVLTGVSATAGTTVITYSLGSSCYQVRAQTVNPLPLAIGGYAIACEGTTTTLTHSNTGTWSSGDVSIANIGTPTVGVVTGVNAGTTLITFTLNSTGCKTTKAVTVNTVPPAITGTGLVCVSLQTTLANAQAGGSWSSSNTYYANVGSATGIVTASGSAGTATISYSYGANCRVTTVVTVRAVPAVILGPSSVCIGSTVTFSNSTGNGTWSSSNTAAATVVTGSSSYYGAVTGVGGGVTTLTYTNAPSCTRTQAVTVAACRGANTTGVGNIENSIAVSLFPNPTTGTFTVSAHTQGMLTVYTLDGKEVSKYEISKGETLMALPNELARGIYMCRYNGEDGSAVMIRLVVE